MNFIDKDTQELATVENVTAAVLQLSLLDESEIQALASSGELTTRFPYHLSHALPADELHRFQLARMAAPARTLTKEERVRVDGGQRAMTSLRSGLEFLIRKFNIKT